MGLHYKGILTEKGFFSGSMNISKNGINLNDESVLYEINEDTIVKARAHFEQTHLQAT